MSKEFNIDDLDLVQDALKNFGAGSNSIDTESGITRRLLNALELPYTQSSQLDLLVLIRQFLMYFDYWQKPSRSELELPKELSGNFILWESIGLAERTINGKTYVSAKKWNPDWLPPISDGVDGEVAGEVICRDFSQNAVPGDPFLEKFRFQTYRSPGQRSAVRATLTTPPAENLIINLPTGEGKSSIFQLIHSVGFMTTNISKNRGLTLVVVPTIALGADLEKETSEICGVDLPLFYESGNQVRSDSFIDKIKTGQNCILFASPEAVTNQYSLLKPALLKAAENGSIKALVVDEAHLIEAWGIDFRDDFQELGSLRDKLINAAPEGEALRTIFLSATIAPSAKSTLEALFNRGEAIQAINAGALRPEPLFLKSKISDAEIQEQRVTNALYYAPRPCILYVSTKADANFWFNQVKELGFNRVGIVHGETNKQDRKEVLEKWKSEKLDLVIGTSAFGIGINYASVRTIIHACVPETLDRFYQEVGRGGRDGKKCLSLLIPKKEDLNVGEKLANKTLIGVQRGLQRWTTMFTSKKVIDQERYFVKYDASPGTSIDDIDMVGDLNTRWNLRVLNLLVRAKAIRLKGPPDLTAYKELQNTGYLEVEPLNDSHLERKFWSDEVEPIRLKIWNDHQNNFNMMKRLIDSEICPAEAFSSLYGKQKIKVQCSSCAICQNNNDKKYKSGNKSEPRSPWQIETQSFLSDLIGNKGRLLVTFESDKLKSRLQRRVFDALYSLRIFGLNKFLQIGESQFDIDRFKKVISDDVIFFDQPKALAVSRLPLGAETIFLGSGHNLTEAELMGGRNARIFICAHDMLAPSGRKLEDVFYGRSLSMKGFLREINS